MSHVPLLSVLRPASSWEAPGSRPWVVVEKSTDSSFAMGGSSPQSGAGPATGSSPYWTWTLGRRLSSSSMRLMSRSALNAASMPVRLAASRSSGSRSGRSCCSPLLMSLSLTTLPVHRPKIRSTVKHILPTSAPVTMPVLEVSKSDSKNRPFSSKRAELKAHTMARNTDASKSEFCWLKRSQMKSTWCSFRSNASMASSIVRCPVPSLSILCTFR
mmetsp:Transcript_101063/g.274671  ORF Transcript_101063/g.274671 Transcript_101063/m.274671 type:complete len:215 (+) Transcript_101063:1069-1713(+)